MLNLTMHESPTQTLPHCAFAYELDQTSENVAYSLFFQKSKYLCSSWKEEIYKTALNISKNCKKEIMLCFSGGIDSEVMCQAFLDLKIPFKVLSLKYPKNLNFHDIQYAIKWCAANDIKHEVLEYDINYFLEKKYLEYVDLGFVSKNVFRYLQIEMMKMAENENCHAILGAGEFLFDCSSTKESAHINFEIGITAPLEWCKKSKSEHQPFFYFSNSEICSAYLKSPLVNFFSHNNNLLNNVYNVYGLKMISHYSSWPEKKGRPKYSGFENIKDLRWQADENLKKIFNKFPDTYQISYENLLESIT